jgi:hypothetical protein
LITRIALLGREVSDFVTLSTTGEELDVLLLMELGWHLEQGPSGKVMRSSVNERRVKIVSSAALNENI